MSGNLQATSDTPHELVNELGQITFYHSKAPDEAMVCLLENTIYGSDGPLYRHLTVREKIGKMENPHFFTARLTGECIGSVCISERDCFWNGQQIKAFYVRYMSVKQGVKEFKGLGRKLLNTASEYFKKNLNVPFVTYALIEEEHKLSLNLSSKFGNRKAGSYEVINFSRFNPRKTPDVRKAESHELPVILELLSNLYRDHALVNFYNAAQNSNCYILEERGEMVAGVFAAKTSWEIVRLPGISGFFTMKLVPFIPYLNRLFNPKNFTFCSFEAIYFKKGQEKQLPLLFESALAFEKVYSAMLFGDPSSTVFKTIKTSVDFGFLSKMQEPVSSSVMLFASDNTKKELISEPAPFYLSAFDQT